MNLLAEIHCEICGALFERKSRARKCPACRGKFLRTCYHCEKTFAGLHASGVTFCPECRAAGIRRRTPNTVRPWSEDAIARNREQAVKQGKRNLPRAIDGVKRSPIAGKSETHLRAKIWRLRAPWGEQFEVRNLTKFIRDHLEWFPAGAERMVIRFGKAANRARNGQIEPTTTGWTLLDEPQIPQDSAKRLAEVAERNAQREAKRKERKNQAKERE